MTIFSITVDESEPRQLIVIF